MNLLRESIALNVAKMAGAVHMITGNIIESVEQQILTANILNVDDGSILQSRQVRGQDIFAMVDDLTALVKNDIDLNISTKRELMGKINYNVSRAQGLTSQILRYLLGHKASRHPAGCCLVRQRIS